MVLDAVISSVSVTVEVGDGDVEPVPWEIVSERVVVVLVEGV